ncbi:MAG: hypothetical protein COU90_04085 [Candidatus Ryanbacteria bacterium CG10_big_fil_rev_8_21_14_0_10_43_42]|uniref:Protease PrsW n=1 Tax=Candidatus Ryanbacteria bacterium CG10_big_fil_rev_8_21_14_0_10_43_42 TaxID=1974864 RepID=A0A2M8KWE1_9BACT|nr:MAG: hypothetical protein COU90_04085 [Candidatus Ryanbacteria bacterium CG10_big_fil_rev_8_21_14_0_10_43_42]
MTSFGTQLLYAVLGGLIPALVWLFFWLREDIHPEPKRLIFKAFLAGGIAIPFALFAESFFYCINAFLFFPPNESTLCAINHPPLAAFASIANLFLIVTFAATEEYVKYKSAKKLVLKGRDFDEPVDAMIYLITVSLGFAAFENMLFLLPAFGASVFEGLIVGNLRFLGATLLHAVSSGIVGYMIALSFYTPEHRKSYTWWGLVLATILHAIFNVLVMSEDISSDGISQTLGVLVLTGVVLIFAFDKVKKLRKFQRVTNNL